MEASSAVGRAFAGDDEAVSIQTVDIAELREAARIFVRDYNEKMHDTLTAREADMVQCFVTFVEGLQKSARGELNHW